MFLVMKRTTALRLALASGVLGFVGGVLGVIDGSTQGWMGVACGVGIFALVTFESRRSPW